VGWAEGTAVGTELGLDVGCSVGLADDLEVGSPEGWALGRAVG